MMDGIAEAIADAIAGDRLRVGGAVEHRARVRRRTDGDRRLTMLMRHITWPRGPSVGADEADRRIRARASVCLGWIAVVLLRLTVAALLVVPAAATLWLVIRGLSR